MSHSTSAPDLGRLSIQDQHDDDIEIDFGDGDGDGDTTDLFASPTHMPAQPSSTNEPTPRAEPRPTPADSSAREASLRAELARVQEVNRVIENVTTSLTKARENMSTVHQTVHSASTLLATWTRILSQTEHNQRLVLDPTWQGAGQDLEDAENEEVRRAAEAERRVIEEQRRREETERRREEEERRREQAASKPARGGARVRGTRAQAGVGRGYTGVGGQAGRGRGTTPVARGSGIGRGVGNARGRGRG